MTLYNVIMAVSGSKWSKSVVNQVSINTLVKEFQSSKCSRDCYIFSLLKHLINIALTKNFSTNKTTIKWPLIKKTIIIWWVGKYVMCYKWVSVNLSLWSDFTYGLNLTKSSSVYVYKTPKSEEVRKHSTWPADMCQIFTLILLIMEGCRVHRVGQISSC